MFPKRLSGFFLCAMTLAVLLVAPACKRSGEDKEIRDLSQKAAELDQLSQQAGASGADQTKKLREAGVNEATLQEAVNKTLAS